MSPTPLPRLGSVVWAEVEDPNGFRKVRPVVVVTATAAIAAGRRLRVVAITTRLPSPLPSDHVLLPWDRDGKARSGLRRKCAAVTTWQAEIAAEDVQEVVGHLPPSLVDELLTKAAAALPPPTDAGDVTPGGGPSTNPPPLP